MARRRYLILANSFVILLVMGISYAWSIFVGPLEADFGWNRAQTSMAFTLNLIAFSGGTILTGILSKRISFTRIIQIGAVMLGTGFLLTTLIQTPWQLYLTYSLLCGGAVGMCYNAIVSTVPLWFLDNQGVATGTLIMGYAFSSSILGPVCHAIITAQGWRAAFVVLAVVNMVILFAGSFLVKVPTGEQLTALPQPAKAARLGKRDFTAGQMIKTRSFYLYLFYVIILAGVGQVIINHLGPAISQDMGQSAAFAAGVVSAISICNGVGRVFWGIVFDKIGTKKTLLVMSAIYTLVLGLVYLAVVMKAAMLAAVAGCMLLFTYGGNATTIPTITRKLFGEKHFSMNYSVISLTNLLAALMPSIAGMMQTSQGNYTMAFLSIVICSALSIGLAAMMKKED